jgi:MFS family permease
MKKTSLQQYTGTFLFASGIAPITSFIMFGVPSLAWYVSIPLGLASGILAGWLTPMVVSIVGKFHQGYNLYNTGFGIGFIAMIFTAILRGLAVDVSVVTTISFDFHWFFFWSTFVVSLVLIGGAFLLHRQVYRPWLRLLQSPGNLPSDYYKEFGLATTLFNMGTIGLFSLLLVLTLNFRLSGPMIAGIYTFMGFGSYGKHIRNATPVMVGLMLASFIPGYSLTNLGPSIALFFVTALAPISGKFGIVYGLIAGGLHLLVAPQALALQGGFDLYNNGFTAGLVAGVVVVIAQNIQLPVLWKRRSKFN